MFYILVALFFSLVSHAFAEDCNEIQCSNVVDYVCGLVVPWPGVHLIGIYQNICYLQKMRCRYKRNFDIRQIPDFQCNIDKPKYQHNNGRRVNDFSIVGAHQHCNHTCPTYCADTYDPACASIWNTEMTHFYKKAMINHCHIDFFSCAFGVNVTIHALSECYENPSPLLFITQVAALKSLRLLKDTSSAHIQDVRTLPSVVEISPHLKKKT